MVHLPTLDWVYGSIGISLVAVIFGVWAMVSAARVRRRYLNTFGDEHPENLEQLIAQLHERVDTAADLFRGFEGRVAALEVKSGESINRLGLVRFNPFMDTGSDLSFSLAVLNDHGDGIVLTSLWGRDEIRLYAKPVENHESRYVMSQEEKQALDMATHARIKSRVETKNTNSI